MAGTMSDHPPASPPLSASDQWGYARQRNESARDSSDIERLFAHNVRFYSALLGPYLPSDKNALILDLPCGEGGMVYALRRLGYSNVIGYDLDQNRLATGLKLKLPLHHGNVFDVLRTQPDSSVGAVFAMDF